MKEFSPPFALKLNEETEVDKFFVGFAASCVTLIVFEDMPVPLIVIVAEREEDVEGLLAVVTVIVPLLAPEIVSEPVPEEANVSHETLEVTFHVVLEVIATCFCSLAPAKLSDEGDTDKLYDGAPACVTEMVLSDTPVPPTVIVAVRFDVDVLAATVAVNDFLPEPDVEDTVSQDELLRTVQEVLDETENVF